MRFTMLILIVVLVFATLPAFGAANYLGGMSGLMYTPDATIEPTHSWELSFHDSLGILPGDDDLLAGGLQYGLLRNLEVGVSLLSDGDSDVTFNGKYSIVQETATAPNITVGIWDLTGNAGSVNGDLSAFILLSKNITPFASRVASMPSKPLRGTLGFGSGIYNGVFASLEWVYSPKLSLMGEFSNGRIGGRDKLFNVGARYAITNSFRLDAGTFDFQRFVFGVSARTAFK